MQEYGKDVKIMEEEPIGKALLNQMPKLIIDLIGESIPVWGGFVKVIANNLYEAIKKGE